MKKSVLFFALMAILTMSGCKPKAENNDGEFQSYMDNSLEPKSDFYAYANGNWMKLNPLPAEYARYGSFDQLAENVQKQLLELVDDLSSKTFEQGSVEWKLSELYKLSMDSTRLNAEAASPIQADLARIAAVADKSELYGVMAQLNRWMVWPFFELYVGADDMNSSMNLVQTYQSGLGMGERDYYLKEDEHNAGLRQAYVAHVARMFERVAGYAEEDALAAAGRVMELETHLAAASFSNEELRDPYRNYNKMTFDELCALTPGFDWKMYVSETGADIKEINVSQKPYIEAVGIEFANAGLQTLKEYFSWMLMNDNASCLDDGILAEDFAFFGKTLSGREEMKPRWKRSVEMLSGSMGEALGEMYVGKYFPQEAKDRMLELVGNLQKSLSERIDQLSWMSADTKVKAQEKLSSFRVKIGYPDKWKDYTSLNINPEDSYYENCKRVSEFYFKENLQKIGKEVDRDEWLMNPQTVNAYYNPTTNEICFPAGILQPPFFYMNGDDAVNYGAIGVVIGHEMTHGFDDQGSQYDKDGNLSNWWTEEDAAQFAARTDVLRNYFNQIEVAPGVFGNGSLTLGENIADYGGLQVSFNAFSKTAQYQEGHPIGAYSPAQRFFLAYAHVWANNIREQEILRRTAEDPHSLGRWRVNGTLPHISAFAEAFGLQEGDPMFLPEAERASIW